jgi:hypothetical protein
MKKTILVALAAFFSQLTFSQDGSSNAAKSSLIAANTPEAKTRVEKIKVVVPSNVTYPSILAKHIEESKEYVENFSKSRRDYAIRMYQRGKKFLPKVASVLKKFNLPTELKVLIALESAYNGNVRSSAGAFGYWQFMDAAAKEYGLKIVDPKDTAAIRLKKVDDRSNFQKSTNAAARYLRDRSRNLNSDWLLVVASYNWGIGNVREAMRATGKANPTFWDIKKSLPSETRAYVMNFIALNVIFNNYDAFVKKQLQFDDKEIEKLVTVEGPEDLTL